jgi:hypothetical protein
LQGRGVLPGQRIWRSSPSSSCSACRGCRAQLLAAPIVSCLAFIANRRWVFAARPARA